MIIKDFEGDFMVTRKLINKLIKQEQWLSLNLSTIVKELTDDELLLVYFDSPVHSISFWIELSKRPHLSKLLL